MTKSETPCGIILLAAGLGKRMRSALPKVLHEVGGQPILFHILYRIREVTPHASVAVVVGHGREQVESAIRGNPDFSAMDIHFVHQPEQRGTGHAARCAMDSPWGLRVAEAKWPVLVLPGDSPLLTSQLISEMTDPLGRGVALRLLTCELPNPTGYGRIVRRGKKGAVLRIVEEKDATIREKAIREVAASIYFFHPLFLKSGLQRISNKNAQGEYYLTDLISMASHSKKRIDVLSWMRPEDLRGINDPWELAQARRLYNERRVEQLARSGVKFLDPWNTWVDAQVEIAEDAVIHPRAILNGRTKIGRDAIVGPGVFLRNVKVGEGANIKAGTVAEDSEIAPKASVGPYAHLRPESFVGEGAKIGNFVELKKSRVGAKTSIAHLSYVGDAEVGERVNIGCGFITCNFDGRIIDGQRKHRTIIEDDVFLGSDCQAIAPVRIGRGSYVASGSTITEDVEPDALAIARSRQVNKPGYAKKLRGQE